MEAKRVLEIYQLFMAGFCNEAGASLKLIMAGCTPEDVSKLLKQWDAELHPTETK